MLENVVFQGFFEAFVAQAASLGTALLALFHLRRYRLERPAIGLDQRRPIDLLATPAGAKLVEDFLSRVEYGVYA